MSDASGTLWLDVGRRDWSDAALAATGLSRDHMPRLVEGSAPGGMLRPELLREWGLSGPVVVAGSAGAGIQPADKRMRESLGPQDWLYTLVEREGDEEKVAVIGALTEMIYAGEDSSEVLARIAEPRIRIVSLTVTENGYCLNRATKRLDKEHRLSRQDLATPERPASAIGIIVEGFRRRKEAGLPAFTALSCDNIQHNGEVLRDAVLTLAGLRDKALAAWIEAEASFPSTMVDRITPVTTEAQVRELAEKHGLADNWPVFAEPFSQWVIEDRFPLGRPA